MIVTIDGPAGAGKSSVSRLLANQLGFAFLDTGAMYRCVTLACLESMVDLNDAQSVSSIAQRLKLRLEQDRVWMDGIDVTERIRDPEVTRAIKSIADNADVRTQMIALQRLWAANRDIVTEGRDQGTMAFPEADCKIFLTASPEERARRRVLQLKETGLNADFESILQLQEQRDLEDRNRAFGGLKQAPDAIIVMTDGLSESEVLTTLESIVRERLKDCWKRRDRLTNGSGFPSTHDSPTRVDELQRAKPE